VPWHPPVVGLGRARVQRDHAAQPAPAWGLAGGLRVPHGPPGAQPLGQPWRQRRPGRHEQAQVDRLVGYPHARVVRVLQAQPLADLLRGPLELGPALHRRQQLGPAPQLARLRPPRPPVRGGVRVVRAVRLAAPVPRHLPGDRRVRAAEAGSDPAQAPPRGKAARDLLPLRQQQLTSRAAGRPRPDPAGLGQVAAHVLCRSTQLAGDVAQRLPRAPPLPHLVLLLDRAPVRAHANLHHEMIMVVRSPLETAFVSATALPPPPSALLQASTTRVHNQRRTTTAVRRL
jgi:hypothetical protein